MFTREGCKSLASNFVLASGVVSLLATSGALLSAAVTLQSWTRPVSLDFQLSSLRKLSELEPRFQTASVLLAPVADESPTFKFDTDPGSPLPRSLRIKQPHVFHAPTVIVDRTQDAAPALTIQQDRVVTTQAVTVGLSAELDEHARMRQLHFLLQQRVIASLKGEELKPLPQVQAVASERLQAQVAESQVAQATDDAKDVLTTQAAAPARVVQSFHPISHQSKEDTAPQLIAQMDTQVNSANPILTDAPPTQSYLFQPLVEQAAVKADLLVEAAQKFQAAGLLGGNPIRQELVASATRSNAALTIQGAQKSLTSEKPVSVPRGLSTALDGQRVYLEAFDYSKNVEVDTHQILTREYPGHGWVIHRAHSHWPTLTRQSVNEVPLMAVATAKILAASLGTHLQADTGIVFGRLPDGWTVEFGGRSEKGLFFNSDQKSISWAVYEGQRYFVFLNAAPGAQLLRLMSNSHASTGAVVVPVQAGTSTYADLTQLKLRPLDGHILNAGAKAGVGLSRVRVRVIGQTGDDAVTGVAGNFMLKDLVTVDDYAVIVESDSLMGVTHRYQLRPNHLSQVELYRLEEEQISSWMAQLEGGISPESGMIVAAPPSDLISGQVEPVTPHVTSMILDANLSPETYTVSPDGQFEIKKGLNPTLPRLVSVQVPQGAVLVEAVSAAKETLWSQMIYSSPKVISLVGPND